VRVDVFTIFPEWFAGPFDASLLGKARAEGLLDLRVHDLRQSTSDRHRSVDDTPYGGGAGMVLRVDCVAAAIEAVEAGTRTHRVLLTPQGNRFLQPMAKALTAREAVTLICGRYEGFDERVRSLVDEEISLGDFVLAGGEIAAMAVIEACIRLLPGVLGNEESVSLESFSEENDGLLEYPQYTRPATFRGEAVPEVLTSGDHARIEAFRRQAALERTLARRPELVRHKGRS